MLNRASVPDPTIRTNETAFSTGVDPTFTILSYIVIVSGASDPTSINVVLKFSNETRNATRPAAPPEGRGQRPPTTGRDASRETRAPAPTWG